MPCAWCSTASRVVPAVMSVVLGETVRPIPGVVYPAGETFRLCLDCYTWGFDRHLFAQGEAYHEPWYIPVQYSTGPVPPLEPTIGGTHALPGLFVTSIGSGGGGGAASAPLGRAGGGGSAGSAGGVIMSYESIEMNLAGQTFRSGPMVPPNLRLNDPSTPLNASRLEDRPRLVGARNDSPEARLDDAIRLADLVLALDPRRVLLDLEFDEAGNPRLVDRREVEVRVNINMGPVVPPTPPVYTKTKWQKLECLELDDIQAATYKAPELLPRIKAHPTSWSRLLKDDE